MPLVCGRLGGIGDARGPAWHGRVKDMVLGRPMLTAQAAIVEFRAIVGHALLNAEQRGALFASA
jgi:hypothetical protein